jgi:hypothetical protein
MDIEQGRALGCGAINSTNTEGYGPKKKPLDYG